MSQNHSRSFIGRVFTVLFASSMLALLGWGWSEREEYWFNAEKGWGYIFGIIGGSLMLLLLFYPLRKRVRFMRRWFSIKYWFQLHMLFGILGPVLILFHSNFHLGSLNSSVALFCMLLVAISGIVGRYVYRNIHRGLYGERLEFKDFYDQYQQSKTLFVDNELVNSDTAQKLNDIEQLLTTGTHSLWKTWSAIHSVKTQNRRVKAQIKRNLKTRKYSAEQARNLKQAYAQWQKGISQLRSVAKLSFNTQLFSLWHILHLPFFFMMLITATIHVVVVHMY